MENLKTKLEDISDKHVDWAKVGWRIRTLSEKNGIPFTEIAQLLNVDRSTISRYVIEKYSEHFSIEQISRVADAYHVRLEYLLAIDDNPYRRPHKRRSRKHQSEEQQLSLFSMIPDDDQKEPCNGRRTYSQDEATFFMSSMRTQGRKGLKMPRINLAFSPENYDYISIMSQSLGKSLTEFVNEIIAGNIVRNQSLYDRIRNDSQNIAY